MTPEHLMLLNPSDLTAVRIECQKCGAASVFRLEGERIVNMPTACGTCHEPFMTHADSNPVGPANHLIHAVADWRQADAQSRPAFRIRFELSPFGHMPGRPGGPAQPPAGAAKSG